MIFFKHIIFAIYSIFWYLKNYFFIKKYFFKSKIINYKIKYFHLWKPNAQYFSGYINNQKIFIKFSKKEYLKREFEAINILNDMKNSYNFFPIILKTELDLKIPNLVFKYIDGTPLNLLLKNKIKFSNDLILKISDAFEDIIIKLHSCNFIHRDVRPHNIILDEKGNVHLIDFTFLIDIKRKNHFLIELPLNSKNIKLLLRLGHGYNNYLGMWDDAFSFMKILLDIGADEGLKIKISKYLNKLTYKLPSKLVNKL